MNAGDPQRAPDGPLVVYGTTAAYDTTLMIAVPNPVEPQA